MNNDFTLVEWFGSAMMKAGSVALTSLFVSSVEKLQDYVSTIDGGYVQIYSPAAVWTGTEHFVQTASEQDMKNYLRQQWDRWEQVHGKASTKAMPTSNNRSYYGATTTNAARSYYGGYSGHYGNSYGNSAYDEIADMY